MLVVIPDVVVELVVLDVLLVVELFISGSQYFWRQMTSVSNLTLN